MASPEESFDGAAGRVDPPDWNLLRGLFSDEGAYRHRMGLRRADAHEFYAPTQAGADIEREKRAILDCDLERYTLVTAEGRRTAGEFVHTLGIVLGQRADDDGAGWRETIRDLSLAIEPDLLLVTPPDWSLAWASVCFPSHWSLEGKQRHSLASIHDAVPGLNSELGSKISAFFVRLVPGEGWRRANWGLSASARRNQHPTVTIPALSAASPPEATFVRVEDQHLLKLPETGAIAFGIRILSFRLSEVMQDDKVRTAIEKKLRTMSTEVLRYKGLSEFITQKAETGFSWLLP